MTYSDAPVDSTEARERREAEAEAEATGELDRRRHAETCIDGWLGEDQHGRPIPCQRCRPHLFTEPCRTCQQSISTCLTKRDSLEGRCCDHCEHTPSPQETRP